MKKNFLISIITPSYNSGDFIERAIKSVLEQDYKHYEHIIVDGGSTDNTLKILNKYKHLKWISEKDGGQSDAMNKGFKMSKGDIIVYLNADDFFYQNAFSSVIDEFKKGAKFVVGNILVKSPRLGCEFINKPNLTNQEILHHWKPNAFPYNPVGYFYKREVQISCPFRNYKVDGKNIDMDLEFLLQASSKYTFSKVNKILGCFDEGEMTKTAISQSKLNYWQPSNFPYLNEYISKLPIEEQILFEKEQREGYLELQERVNSHFNFEKILLPKSLTPKISFIIPTFNDIINIDRAIDSVFSQNIKNFEIIVVDDNSTDGTYEKLKNKYSKNYVKVVRHKKNLKLGAARNTGIKLSNGKYIFFLDSDDWIQKESILKLISIAENYNTEITAFGINKVWDDGRTEKYHGCSFACSGGIEALKYYSEYKIASTAWNKLYLRSFIVDNNLKFISPYWHEDIMFTANALLKCKKYLSISDPYYNYFQRPNSIIRGNKNILHLRSYIKLLTEMEKFIRVNNIETNPPGEILSSKLIRSHAINDLISNLHIYKTSSSPKTWEKDIKSAFKIEIPELHNSLTELFILLESAHTNYKQDIKTITESESKLLANIRKIKHIFIPNGSFTKKLYEKSIKRIIQ